MKTELSKLSQILGTTPDLFICSASYEDRSISIAKEMNFRQVGKVLILENEDFSPHIRENSNFLHKWFGEKATTVLIRTDSPLLVADSLKKNVIPSIEKCLGICLIDITTFTHEHLLIFIKMISELNLIEKIKLAYTGVEKYSFNTPQNEEWLSRGLRVTRSVLGYPVTMLTSRKLHLIILVGFEYERAEKLIQAYEPALLSLGLGNEKDAINSQHYKKNEKFHNRVRQFAEGMLDSMELVNQFEFSCIDPLKTKTDILLEVKKHPHYNVALCPMNTKPSTLGAALACLTDESIQLIYTQPLEYNLEGYSKPSNTCALFDLNDLLVNQK